MSFYAKYLAERTNDRILETEYGFATYRMIPDQKAVYIIDLYVDPDFRMGGAATAMADEIAEISKYEGCTKMIGSVVPYAKNSTQSIQVLIAYGMKVSSSTPDFIYFEKEI